MGAGSSYIAGRAAANAQANSSTGGGFGLEPGGCLLWFLIVFTLVPIIEIFGSFLGEFPVTIWTWLSVAYFAIPGLVITGSLIYPWCEFFRHKKMNKVLKEPFLTLYNICDHGYITSEDEIVLNKYKYTVFENLDRMFNPYKNITEKLLTGYITWHKAKELKLEKRILANFHSMLSRGKIAFETEYDENLFYKRYKYDFRKFALQAKCDRFSYDPVKCEDCNNKKVCTFSPYKEVVSTIKNQEEKVEVNNKKEVVKNAVVEKIFFNKYMSNMGR